MKWYVLVPDKEDPELIRVALELKLPSYAQAEEVAKLRFGSNQMVIDEELYNVLPMNDLRVIRGTDWKKKVQAAKKSAQSS